MERKEKDFIIIYEDRIDLINKVLKDKKQRDHFLWILIDCYFEKKEPEHLSENEQLLFDFFQKWGL
jgi:hypothetical protein